MEKPGEDLKARAAEMERNALKAAINLVEVSQLVDLPELLEHCVVEKFVAQLQLQQQIQQEAEEHAPHSEALCRSAGNSALVDIDMIWRMATPSAEDVQTHVGTTYK